MSISLATVWLLIKKLPAENEFFDAAEALYATPEFGRFETAAETLVTALGGSVTRDPATNRIATINPPPATYAGAHGTSMYTGPVTST